MPQLHLGPIKDSFVGSLNLIQYRLVFHQYQQRYRYHPSIVNFIHRFIITNWLHMFMYSTMAGRKKSGAWKHFVINTVNVNCAACLHCQESISRRGKQINNSNLHKRLASSHAGKMCIVSTRYWYRHRLFLLCQTSVLKVSAKCGISGTLNYSYSNWQQTNWYK